jgi:hypothetical protein
MADRKLQHEAHMAYRREAKDDKKKVCAGLSSKTPTPAVGPKRWEESFGQ